MNMQMELEKTRRGFLYFLPSRVILKDGTEVTHATGEGGVLLLYNLSVKEKLGNRDDL